MFNNLIESSSHRDEFRRRGSFFLFTTAIYALLFVITGVISIYAYDARLEHEDLEVVMLLPPVDLLPTATPPTNQPDRSQSSDSRRAVDVRRIAVASVNQPSATPNSISTKPNPFLPVRPNINFVIGERDANAALPVGPIGVRNGNRNGTGPVAVGPDLEAPPPIPPSKPKQTTVRISRVLNSQALFLPKPTYPLLARQIRIQGVVNVQVLINEKGSVISATAISGHPLLVPEAQKAAMLARFSPTVISDQPVQVSGVITYNFVMQ